MNNTDTLTVTIRVETLTIVRANLLVWQTASGMTVYFDCLWHAVLAVITPEFAYRRLRLRLPGTGTTNIAPSTLQAIDVHAGKQGDDWKECDDDSWQRVMARLTLTAILQRVAQSGGSHEAR